MFVGDVLFCSREKQATLPPAEKDKSLFEEYSQTRSVGESARVESGLSRGVAWFLILGV